MFGDKISLRQAFEYETASRWWTGWVSWWWARTLAGKYLMWVTKRKHRRYSRFLEVRDILNNTNEKGEVT